METKDKKVEEDT